MIKNTTASSVTTPPTLGGFTAWLVVMVSALFFFYEFVQMNMFDTINADLMQTYNVSAASISNLSAGYFYADVLLLFPAGIILDKFSTRKLLSFAMAASVIATFCFSLTSNYWIAFAMRLVSGFGAAFNLLSSLRLASRWFPSSKLALVTGAVVTMAMLGGFVAQTPMTLLVNSVGWRHAVQIDALMGAVFLNLIILLVKDYPEGYVHIKTKSENKLPIMQTIKKILNNRQNWLAGFYTSFLNLPIVVLGALWGIQYLTQIMHFSRTQASLIASMLFIGTIIGSPIFGFISDKIKRRKPLMIAGAIASIFVVLLIRYAGMPSFGIMLSLFLLLGIFTSTQVISYPVITESNSLALTGAALGMSSILIQAGGAVFQPLVGLLLDAHWNGLKVNNIPVYSANDYHFAFMIFPIAFIIGLIFAFLIRETNATEEHRRYDTTKTQ